MEAWTWGTWGFRRSGFWIWIAGGGAVRLSDDGWFEMGREREKELARGRVRELNVCNGLVLHWFFLDVLFRFWLVYVRNLNHLGR